MSLSANYLSSILNEFHVITELFMVNISFLTEEYQISIGPWISLHHSVYCYTGVLELVFGSIFSVFLVTRARNIFKYLALFVLLITESLTDFFSNIVLYMKLFSKVHLTPLSSGSQEGQLLKGSLFTAFKRMTNGSRQ